MLSRTRTFAILAIVSGVIAGLLLLLAAAQNSRSLNARVAQQVQVLGQQQTVLVAKRTIDANVILGEGDVELREFFEVDLASDATPAQALADVEGKPARVPILAGEPVYLEKLGTGFKVSGLIPSGTVAFAMPIQPEYAVGALITQGDLIDIIKVSGGAAYGESPEPTSILFRGVEVLGVAGEYPYGGTLSSTGSEQGQGSAGFGSTGRIASQEESPVRDKILLLRLTQQEAVNLADALENSRLYIALHSRQ